jgi:hypothetical protein
MDDILTTMIHRLEISQVDESEEFAGLAAGLLVDLIDGHV